MTKKIYTEKIEEWITSSTGGQVKNFNSLLVSLPGVDPVMVKAQLESLFKKTGDTKYKKLLNGLISHDSNLAVRKYTADSIVPHPLEFDWRFSEKAIEVLLDNIRALPNKDKILLLGAPTLAKEFEKKLPQSMITLVDNNVLWEGKLAKTTFLYRDITTDIFPIDLSEMFDVVIIDPPWYMNHFHHFISFGSQALKLGCKLLISVPAVGTRPKVLEERQLLDSIAASNGLKNVCKEKCIIPYETPPFEHNAFMAAGLHIELNQWRSGDLWSFERTERKLKSLASQVGNIEWLEHNINGVRIKFKIDRNIDSSMDVEVMSIVPKDILPSVSTRHHLRDSATIWTSGNRIFRCRNTKALFNLIKKARNHSAYENLSELELRSVQKIFELVKIETEEYIMESSKEALMA